MQNNPSVEKFWLWWTSVLSKTFWRSELW